MWGKLLSPATLCPRNLMKTVFLTRPLIFFPIRQLPQDQACTMPGIPAPPNIYPAGSPCTLYYTDGSRWLVRMEDGVECPEESSDFFSEVPFISTGGDPSIGQLGSLAYGNTFG
jgi:hypothetical protein